MKKTKTKISKNKMLAFLCGILVICTGMLSFFIIFGQNKIEPQIPANQQNENKNLSSIKLETEKSETAVAKEKTRLHVQNGEMTIENQKPDTTETTTAIENSAKIPDSLQESGSIIPVSGRKETETPATAKRLVFVIDDAGHNLTQLEPFLELPFPVTIAVLPMLSYSVQTAQLTNQHGKELILHQPMQAQKASIDPGPGAIKPTMTPEEAAAVVRQNLTAVGSVSGINNHEGSLITENADIMKAVLEICAQKDIYFLDSRTTSNSMVKTAAQNLSVKIWERSVFLDNSQNKDDITQSVRYGMELAERNGIAIMIGHVWSDNLAQTLLDLYPDMVLQGFEITTLSQL
ncbi:MAG: divergent polysaccharide deacetylase family protein [Spirochaetaceae bacterium]|nr:divergent polysaccharide deacetylase family protein [Spirochaetaceae bacterium]